MPMAALAKVNSCDKNIWYLTLRHLLSLKSIAESHILERNANYPQWPLMLEDSE